MKLSVAICTYDRPELLKLALESLARQQCSHPWQLFVVDNACQDSIHAICDSFNVRYIPEPQLGLSHARNRACSEADGRYIAFIDDDAQVRPHWAEAICTAFDRQPDRIGCVSGPVRPLWQTSPPAWLNTDLQRYLSVVDWGPEGFFAPLEKMLPGVNIAFKRDAVQAAGGFATDSGRKGKSLLSNEEFELRFRLHSQGLLSWYEPDAQVDHHIPAARTNWPWFRRRVYWQGISDVVTRSHGIGSQVSLKHLARWILQPGNWRWAFSAPRTAAQALRAVKFWRNLGMLIQRIRMGRTSNAR